METTRVTSRADDGFRTELETAVRDLARRIDRYNAMAPPPSLALVAVSAAALLASAP